MKKILTCVGTRPNFIKIVKLRKLFEQAGFEYKLLHTGQHFDYKMSEVFFKQFGFGEPDFYLNIGGGSNNDVVGRIIIEMDKVLTEYRPDMVIVPGDVNSTFACCFAAASLQIPVAHIEGGLRSFDMEMPEERNRILTDSLSDLIFVTEQAGVDNLQKSGFDSNKIKLVGNTIIDALKEMLPQVDKCTVLEDLEIKKPYCAVTFHRPVNVDREDNLKKIVEALTRVSGLINVVFPVHPRTRKQLEKLGLLHELEKSAVKLIDPLGYIEFLKLMKESTCVLSDSGGVQIETSYFNIPCFTVRDTAELRITLEEGTNQLLPLNQDIIAEHVQQVIAGYGKKAKPQWLWDGNASERIVQEVKTFLAV
jgi:UDP-N-acetylglucosamine 2-epimerase (non-hydrolysing)